MCFQPGIGFGKMPAAEKSVVSGQGRRVRTFEDEMLALIDERFFASGVPSPENKDDMFFLFGNNPDNAVCEPGPAAFGMGIRPMGEHR